MKQRRYIYYSSAQRSEVWDRWQAGESMSSIGRRFDRESSSVLCNSEPSKLPRSLSSKSRKASPALEHCTYTAGHRAPSEGGQMNRQNHRRTHQGSNLGPADLEARVSESSDLEHCRYAESIATLECSGLEFEA
jgi:hypothetical protein